MNLKQLRRDALAIFQASLKAVDPVNAIREHVKIQNDLLTVGKQNYDLAGFEGIYVIGVGKASAAMAQPIEELLGERIKSGFINVKYGHTLPLNIIQVNEAGHPVPDEAGLSGSKKIVKLLSQTGEKDLVMFLISGGGSALLPYPAEGLTLEDKQQMTKCLLEVGATIHEINALRKHVSRVKGGRLAKLAFPSALISLILSDVIGDNLDSIASGPTVPDESTFGDCLNILEKYELQDKISPKVLEFLEEGALGRQEETPKAEDPAFKRTQNVIIGNNIMAVKAAKQKAQELGYETLILSTLIEGEAREVAKVHAAIAKEIKITGHPIKRPACIISGGEITVTIRGQGLGGRNQEFALAAAITIDRWDGIVVLSGGTDGTDGPTDAAGAIADGTTVSRAKALQLDAQASLQENDSYHFFQSLNDLIMTGPTYTNVMDVRLLIIA